MNDSITLLAAALRQRLSIIADEQSRRDPAQHMARLKAVSDKIEQLQSALPPTADPRLTHFLERRSYDKALEWIEKSDA
jgi:hypothetical protein